MTVVPARPHPARAGAFILDWDGVLADTRLDFLPLRRKYFGGKIIPLIEAAEGLSPPERSEVLAEIRRVEMEGAERAVAVKGARELIEWLRAARRPWAVVSRNCRDSILLAAEKCGVALPPVLLSREDPYAKPDPRVLALAAERLGVRLSDCVMVGDFIYDLQAAKNAGIPGVLVGSQGAEKREWEALADFSYATVEDFVRDLNAAAVTA
ncbi:MAG: HAD family hydrolase [Synergistaceae bacterium]|jgi:HAD superfamily hydrolase (TIGR01509 family)|nr:HAD family hydrolase [Synergistaceae bacterium]